MAFTSVSPQLRYFFEVAKAGSFRLAAERINVAASALNRHITLLEAELKVLLFERRPGRGKLKLTAAGESLVHRVRLSMKELQVARSEIEALKGVKRGIVSIGINDSLSRSFLPKIIAGFHESYPRIDFEVAVDNTPALLDRIERDEIEVILAYNVPIRSCLRPIVAFPLGMCVLMANTHPLANHDSLRLSDCIGHSFAVPDNSMFLAHIQQEMLTKAGIDARAVLKTNSSELIKDIVASGMAISIQTHSLLAKDSNRPNLKSIPLTGTCSIPHELACCIRAGRELPIAGSLFVDALKARLTQLGNESACEDELE